MSYLDKKCCSTNNLIEIDPCKVEFSEPNGLTSNEIYCEFDSRLNNFQDESQKYTDEKVGELKEYVDVDQERQDTFLTQDQQRQDDFLNEFIENGIFKGTLTGYLCSDNDEYNSACNIVNFSKEHTNLLKELKLLLQGLEVGTLNYIDGERYPFDTENQFIVDGGRI